MTFFRHWKRLLLLAILVGYTVFSAGPFLWVGIMSLRTTAEISANAYGLPVPAHWDQFVTAWTTSKYGVYFWNSTVVVVSAVILVTAIGAMAAHGLARYRFRLNRPIFFIIFSAIIFPAQITLLALFQVLVKYHLFNTHAGLTLVYVALQLPLTIYILEGFFARIPQDLFDAAKMDGYSDFEIFWKIALPVGLPAVATTVIVNFIFLWNEFLFAVVLITDDDKRTLPLGIQKFMGDQMQDIGMISAGVMISVLPVLILYALFSETLIRGMTAGAVK